MQFREVLKDIKVYEAGKPIELVVRDFGVAPQDVVKLASNENPKGTSPKVTQAIANSAHKAFLYPDDSMFELKEGLANKYNVESSNIVIGAGSDQVLEFVSRTLLEAGDKVLMSQVTFAMYEVYARQMGAQIIRTPNYRHIVDEFIAAYNEHRPKIVYICTPNNPTGDATSKADVLAIINAIDDETMIVVDGAYMEYAAAKDEQYRITPNDLIEFENVIYLGTFSKAYGLGGMRVGYGVANENIITALHKMRPPFNITTLSLVAGIEALKDEQFVTDSIALHQEQIKRYESFAKDNGFSYIESYTNFITYLFPDSMNSTQIANALLRKGVIIRDLASYNMNAMRITIGTEAQNSRFFEEFTKIIA